MSRAGRVFAWSLGALLVVALAAVAWVGVRGLLAYSHLETAQTQLAAVAQSADGSVDAAALSSVGEDLWAAHDLTSDPVWRGVERLPWVGPQLAAVSAVAAAGADLSASTLAPVAELASDFSLDAFRPVNGGLDIAVLTALRDTALSASAGLDRAVADVAAVDQSALLRPIREQVDRLEGQLESASTLAEAAVALPSMLGADGPRTWLLLFQNNAELRSLGGMPGATAVITADAGRITLDDRGTATIPRFDEPVVDLGPERIGIYGERPAVWFSGTTILPDFAQAAVSAREMWKLAHGVEADGVVSLDPFALSYLLRATGPITLPTGEVLTSENVVDVLLRQVYLDYPDPAVQNDVFASATAAVFAAVVSGAADPTAMIAALAQAAEERRLLLWSSEEDEQALFHVGGMAGTLPVSDDETARFGVYVNDGTGSKLGPFLDVDVTVEWDDCSAAASGSPRTATLVVDLANTAPADAATTLPDDIVGGNYGVPAGVLRVVTYIYVPESAILLSSEGTPVGAFGGGTDSGHRVLSHQVDLAPGGASTVRVTVSLDDSPAKSVAAEITPGFGATTATSRCAL